MYGVSDLMGIMQQQGAVNNPDTIQLAVMTGPKSLIIGDELALTEEQLYFFERDTYRMARTHRPPKKIKLSSPITCDKGTVISEMELTSDSSVKDHDNTVYDAPYKEGDLVAVICISSGQYLVLGKVIAGSEVKDLDEQTDLDWSLEGNYESAT